MAFLKRPPHRCLQWHFLPVRLLRRRKNTAARNDESLVMPAEWEPHDSTWLTWPKNKTTWPGPLLKEVESVYLQMISALLPQEKVQLLVDNEKTAKAVLSFLPKKAKTQNLKFHFVRTVDTWIRDYGPIFVRRQTTDDRRQKTDVAFTKWEFNAWGGKYDDLARDNDVVDRIKILKKTKRFDPGIVLEGGSIDVNGQGVCLTTEQCLLNPGRNPKLTRKDLEHYLKRYLGIEKVIWLKEGIEGDDTDGHVDDISRFVDANKIVTAVENDTGDKNHAILKENLEILKTEKDQNGNGFQLIELPMPGKVGLGRDDAPGERLPASYANFYIGNGVLLAPIYSHANDKEALKVLRRAFPKRLVVGIECTSLVYGLGSIHCVTQQEPR